jgi:Lar family restriction alleviation protein
VSELKPCPFCGGEATVRNEAARRPWIECIDCRAATNLRDHLEDAIELWNRRVEVRDECK